MGNLLYSRYSDNLARTATVAVNTGTAAAGYPAANLVDGDPALPAKLNETSGSWTFDLGSAMNVDVVAVIHHNLAAGSNVSIQGNATNAWGAPSLSQAITIPVYAEDGFPVNPWLDLTPFTRSFRWWRLLISTVQAAPVAIGEVLLVGTKRQLEVNFDRGAQTVEDHPVVEHVTSHLVARLYDLGVRRRRFKGTVTTTTDAGFASLQALHRDAHGRVRPFLVVVDPAVNDAWFARFDDATFTRTMPWASLHDVPFGFEELSRGLPL